MWKSVGEVSVIHPLRSFTSDKRSVCTAWYDDFQTHSDWPSQTHTHTNTYCLATVLPKPASPKYCHIKQFCYLSGFLFLSVMHAHPQKHLISLCCSWKENNCCKAILSLCMALNHVDHIYIFVIVITSAIVKKALYDMQLDKYS